MGETAPLIEPVDAEAILANCRAIAPELGSLEEEGDRLRRLPSRAVELLRQAGAFRIAMPREWGGPECTPMDQVRIIEELASANGAAGWCAMIGSDGGFFQAEVDPNEARSMWADMDAPTATTAFPPGRAVPVEGGYRITGRWPYASGATHSSWAGGSCIVYDGDAPRLTEQGTPQSILAFVSSADFELNDNWETTGLRGSGSLEWFVTDHFVPAARCAPGLGTGKPNRPEPLYQFPMMFLCNQAGIPLGLARAAISEFLAIAEGKRQFGASIRKSPHVQDGLGQAVARYRGARGYVMDAQAELWDSLCAGRPPSMEERVHFRLSIVHAHKECLAAVDCLYELAGGAAHYVPSRLDRIMRDVRMANQHVAASRAAYATAGQHLLGNEIAGMRW